jgi:hypothetical protein
MADATRFLDARGVLAYLEWVLVVLGEEGEAWGAVLPASRSRRAAFLSLKRTLVDERAPAIEAALVPLLTSDDQPGLRSMFMLLRRLPQGLAHLAAVLQAHVLAMASEALQAVGAAAEGGGSATAGVMGAAATPAPGSKLVVAVPGDAHGGTAAAAAAASCSSSSSSAPPCHMHIGPRSPAHVEAFVSAALTIHAKFDAMVHEVFDSEPSLVALLARCSRLSLNATDQAAELLASYCALPLAAHDSPPSSAAASHGGTAHGAATTTAESPGPSSGSAAWGSPAAWGSSRVRQGSAPGPPAASRLLKPLGFGTSDAEVSRCRGRDANPPPPPRRLASVRRLRAPPS